MTLELDLVTHMKAHAPDLVFYHKNCNDGLMAALVHYRYYAPMKEIGLAPNHNIGMYFAASASHPLKTVLEINKIETDRAAPLLIHVLDLSYTKEELDECFGEGCYTAIILDHHKHSVNPHIASKTQRWFHEPVEPLKVNMYWDSGRSGASLVSDVLRNDRTQLVKLVEDRDLWRFAHGDDTMLFFSLTSLFDSTLDEWLKRIPEEETLSAFSLQMLADADQKLHDERIFIFEYVRDNRPQRLDLGGTRVQIIKAPVVMHSEIGNVYCATDLAKDPIVMFYPPDTNGNVQMSIRSFIGSAVTAIDTAKFIVKDLQYKFPQFTPPFGGHEHAASVTVPLSYLPDSVQRIANTLNRDEYKKRN